MNPLKLEHNETTRFFLPLMFPDSTHDQLFGQYFQEAYIGMLDDNKYDDALILKFDNATDYGSVVNMGDEDKQHSPVETIINNNHTLFVFDIPESLQSDYGNFLIGNYEGLSDEAKNPIVTFWSEDEPSMLHGVLYAKEDSIKLLAPVFKSNEIGRAHV